MPPAEHGTGRVSRETRRLLATALLSLAALWVLARIRFPERPVNPNPVVPVLSQISPRVAFEDLERQLSELQPQLEHALSAVRLEAHEPGGSARQAIAALRLLPDRAIGLVPDAAAARGDATLGARDAATGLTVIGTPAEPAASLAHWRPLRGAYAPRYLVAAEAWHGRIHLRPVYCGAFHSSYSAEWGGEVWSAPPDTGLPRGALVFTTSGALVGLAVGEQNIVPAGVLVSAAERLMAAPPGPAGWLGLDVQPLLPAVARASGAASGVVVARVDPRGPAAGKVFATDVIEAVGDAGITGPGDWAMRSARATVGEALALRVRRARAGVDVLLTAAPPPSRPPPSPRLGLTLRGRRGTGSEVLSVEEDSAAARAGIRVGDVVTRIGTVDAPSPAAVRRNFVEAGERGVLVAVTRAGGPLVLALSEQ